MTLTYDVLRRAKIDIAAAIQLSLKRAIKITNTSCARRPPLHIPTPHIHKKIGAAVSRLN